MRHKHQLAQMTAGKSLTQNAADFVHCRKRNPRRNTYTRVMRRNWNVTARWLALHGIIYVQYVCHCHLADFRHTLLYFTLTESHKTKSVLSKFTGGFQISGEIPRKPCLEKSLPGYNVNQRVQSRTVGFVIRHSQASTVTCGISFVSQDRRRRIE